MDSHVRDWARMTEWYRLLHERRLTRHEGRLTVGARCQQLAARVRGQFLPHYGSSTAIPGWRMSLRKFGGERTLPDFACIGPIKSGTTDLAVYLLQHPCILPPLAKEIRTQNPNAWRRYYPTVREKERAAKLHGKALTGFFDPLLHSVRLIDNYHAARPDARIILILRNPVDRAYSHYKAELAHGDRSLAKSCYLRTFGDYIDLALDLFPAMPAPQSLGVPLLQTGIYVKAVQLWRDRFGRDNVRVVRAEDFFQDIPAAVCGIHEFLGIPPLRPTVHPIVHKNPIQAPPLDEETRRKLAEFYRPWNEKLYAVIGRDMHWDP
jgi:hypothetical protein